MSEPLPKMDFNTLVVSLSQTTLVHLGKAPSPDADSAAIDLELARQTIDLLEVLQEKTKGNLTGAEETLLGQVLCDLRLGYVEVSQSRK